MKVSPLKLVVSWLMLAAMVLLVACSTGTMPKSRPTTLTPAEQEEQDPEFWRMWQEQRGLGE